MYFVYLLQSTADKTFYIGNTGNLGRRLIEHNTGKVYYTNRKTPWNLIYYEAYQTRETAREREKQLKRFSSAYMGLLKRLGFK